MDMQNVSNLEIPEGEVRTIHDKDNRLLWGRVHYDTKYKGDTTQQTYSGKNLFNPASTDYIHLGSAGADFTQTPIANGLRLTFTQNLTSSNPYAMTVIKVGKVADLVGKTITFSATTKASSTNDTRTYLGTCDSGFYNRQQKANTTSNNVSLTWTVADDGNEYVMVALYATVTQPATAGTYMDYMYPQLEIGSSPTSYEPYVGSTPTQITPSPNPDYPQDINVVTGEQTVTVSGKNLLNTMTFVKGRIDNGVIGYESGTTSITPTENSITFVTNQTFRGVASSAIEVTASTDYALQFTYDSYEGYMSRSINAYDENNDWISVVSVTSNGIFTTPANCKYVRLSFIESGVGTAVIKNLQIEKGSTVTSWEAYQSTTKTVDLGSIELCKIGDYQDYIYKSGDDWYVHKAVGKVVFDGTETWQDYVTQFTGYYTAFETTKGKWGDGGNFANKDNFITNYFQSNGGSLSADFQFISSTGYAVYLKINSTIVSTLAELKTWLGIHNTTVYYVLATPTDTKITDSTLTSQLNAIHEWLVRYGYYGAVSTSSPNILPMIIDRTNL